MTQDMRQIIRTIIVVVSLVMGAAGQAWALTEDDIIIKKVPADIPQADGSVTIVGGMVEKSVSERTVTLTVTPASGYYIKKSMITVEKMVALSRTRANDNASMLGDILPQSQITGSADETSSAIEYGFTLPEDWGGAYVTVRFYQKNSDASVTQIFTYDEFAAITATGHYELMQDIDVSSFSGFSFEFTGTLDGGLHTIMNLNAPLFKTANGIIRNVILDKVNITAGDADGNTGAIACVANSSTRIYNCGILSGSVGGSGNVGGLVGQLNNMGSPKNGARVINCYSYATITGGNNVGGIVGNNTFATTASDIRTMVMNCMFYGDITGGNYVSPVYGGENINNVNSGGLATYNYYAYSQLKTKAVTETSTKKYYNCALAMEERFITRFELYRQLLNSNKKLAAFYATGSAADADKKMAKWVLETADRTNPNPKPYPVLKPQGRYPSIINYDVDHAPDSASVGRYNGGILNNSTLSVTIYTKSQKTTGGQTWPTAEGSDVQKKSLTLYRTDKDSTRFNFNYDKVQLPYYNDVGTGNYTENRVVTGWKIVDITTIDDDPYTSVNYNYSKTYSSNKTYFDAPNYNFADRKSSNKDLYTVSGRVFSQGAYFDVPYGVTSITIEPYWATAAYVSDEYYDVVLKADNFNPQKVTQLGKCFSTGKITIDGSEQTVHTTISSALGTLSGTSVYDNAIVLVGNLHQTEVPSKGDKPFTMMSVDLDEDNEPDYSMIYHDKNRTTTAPIRFDFLNIPGSAQAQKPNGSTLICNAAVFKTRGWFEITNTTLIYFSQFEYENNQVKNDDHRKDNAPLILLGGVYDQFVSTQQTTVAGKTIYIHVGGNAWFSAFGMGTHSDGSESTPHVPVSVTGGDYATFYLTGTYQPKAKVRKDNAECYISGGRFGEAAGASQEQIEGNVTWQIYDADITDFFGGGVNAANPITGNIEVNIINSHVGTYCGGPKFGDMGRNGVQVASAVSGYSFTPDADRTVVTNATGCTFGKFFGAGNGGNSYLRLKYWDQERAKWKEFSEYEKNYTKDKGMYFNGHTTNAPGNSTYGQKGPGVAADFDYEFFVWTSGTTGKRFYVKFVTFSQAKTNDVTSNLKNCTITDNFYGGGNLGTVLGTATSVLDGCTIKGSVYGGGFSASIPTIDIRDGGFSKYPNINDATGMFEPGEKTGTTKYEWMQVDAMPDNGKPGTKDGKYVYTDVDLDALGQVKNSNLIIRGATTVEGCVYGGGALASMADDGTTKVNLIGGTINGDVYGGGEGRLPGMKDDEGKDLSEVKAMVGSTNVNLNGIEETDYTVEKYGALGVDGPLGLNKVADTDTYYTVVNRNKGCVVKGSIFGCNNLNGTPKGNVSVNIYKTKGYGSHIRTGADAETEEQRKLMLDDIDDNNHHYEVAAVYGGGNLAAYEPDDAANKHTHVKIYGCDLTSIRQVYGGGNAASTPATQVDIYGTYEIEEVFGGGNGKDDISRDGGKTYILNPGANVGYKDYWDYANNRDLEDYDTKAKRQESEYFQENYVYGSGEAHVNIHGGKIHRVYGGSNTRGNVKNVAVTMLEDVSGCDFDVDQAYGGGKSAPMDGVSRLEMSCIPGLKNAYGGAEAADIQNDVVLNITNGNFDRVFGGNNVSGVIHGTITVNIEETGCRLLTIGQLYGGGNQAPYEAPFKVGSTTERKPGPTLNIRSFSSIGDVYGGGYGKTATVTGDTHVNINVCEGGVFTDQDAKVAEANVHTGNKELKFAEFRRTDDGGFETDDNGDRVVDEKTVSVYMPPFENGSIGGINNVFGGGNAAKVIGDTYVNIGTVESVVFKTPATKTVNNVEVDTSDSERTHTVKGAKIIGNVYGGGNEAEVTGQTHVNIGRQENANNSAGGSGGGTGGE